MSRNYDNWERLVAAVLKKEQIWQLCHQPSISSISSDFSSSFRSSASFSDFGNRKFEFKTLAGIGTTKLELEACRLVLFKRFPFAFGLEELLMAPSLPLGDELETFKKAYVVSFSEDIMIVAKRLQRGVAKEQVLRWLKVIECIEHENVSNLRGYLLTEDEIFGFYDFFHQGSVHTMLHGVNGVGLDWEARIRIAVGVAKGLVHIHGQKNDRNVHGNIKASSIFVNSQEYGCIDIEPVISRATKYHPAEVLLQKQVSKASDVYSFGVLLMELLSGISPLHYAGESFAHWALRNARDEWSVMLFDKGLLNNPLAKKGMFDMLVVALSCLKKNPQERPNMKHVVKVLERIPTHFSF